MKEFKAVEILTLMQRVDDVSTRQMQKEINEALAELTAHKAKIDVQKEWCNDELDKYSEYQTDIECGLFQAYNNVFQKLEEPTNE